MAMVTIGVRVNEELAARVDKIAELLTARASGVDVKRSDAARLALERGVAALQAELAIGEKPRKAGKRAAKGA